MKFYANSKWLIQMCASRQKEIAIFPPMQNSAYQFYMSPSFQYLTFINIHINIFYMRFLFLSLILPQIIISAVPPPAAQPQNSQNPNWLNYKRENKSTKNNAKLEFSSNPSDPQGQNNGHPPQKRLEQKITNKTIEKNGQNPISGGNSDKINSTVLNQNSVINQHSINLDQIPKTKGYVIKINKVQKDIQLPPVNENPNDTELPKPELLNELKNIVENKINPQIKQIKLNQINLVSPPKLNIQIIRQPQRLRPIKLITQQQQVEANNFPLYSVLPPQVSSSHYAPRVYYQRYTSLYRPRNPSELIDVSVHPQIEIELPHTYFSPINSADKYQYQKHQDSSDSPTNGLYGNP